MLQIDYMGRRGNNLFQYFTGIILSEMFNQNIKNPLNTKILKHKLLPDKNLNKTIEVTDENIYQILQNKTIDANLFLSGFFQNEIIVEKFDEYYTNLIDVKSDNNGVFVHVRLGDLLVGPTGRWANQEYYETVLNSINFEYGFISSDSPNHPIIQNLIKKYSLKLFDAAEDDLILFASSFKNKILSLGTFSWWMGYLGCQENVFFPDPNKYLKWHGNIMIKKNWNLV